MAFDIARFNSAFSEARHQQYIDENFDLAATQEKLRELVADEPEGDDRAWALRMIDKLAEPLPEPREWSPLYYEAAAIHGAAYPVEGTLDEQLSALAEARRRIWAIAARARQDEEADIRAMTRSLEHIEIKVREPSADGAVGGLRGGYGAGDGWARSEGADGLRGVQARVRRGARAAGGRGTGGCRRDAGALA